MLILNFKVAIKKRGLLKKCNNGQTQKKFNLNLEKKQSLITFS